MNPAADPGRSRRRVTSWVAAQAAPLASTMPEVEIERKAIAVVADDENAVPRIARAASMPPTRTTLRAFSADQPRRMRTSEVRPNSTATRKAQVHGIDV